MKHNNKKNLETALINPLLVDYDIAVLQKLAKTLSKTKLLNTTAGRTVRVAICGSFMTKFFA